MIDDKINDSLKEIERELQNVRSARNQVNSTVASYEALRTATSSYVNSLNNIKEEVTKLVKVVGEDYKGITIDFKKQQNEIQEKAKSTLESISKATEQVQNSVASNIKSLQTKLTLALVINILTIIAIVVLHFIK